MVHTAYFVLILSPKESKKIMKRFGHYPPLANTDIGVNIAGITFTMLKCLGYSKYKASESPWIILIHVDFIKLLGKPNITQSDLPTVILKLNDCLHKFCTADVDNLILKRLDYRFDIKIPDEKEREILFTIYKKSKDRSCYMSKNTRYSNSYYYNSKSRAVNVYDKTDEREAMNITPESYEQDVLRFEARLLSRHLRYLKKQYGTSRNIRFYFDEQTFEKYMKKMIVDTYYKGDFYNFYYAKKIILNSNQIRDRDKQNLTDFIKDISFQRSVTKACNKLTPYKSKRYIKLLESINLNPLLIPKHYGVTHIQNPLRDLYTK